MSLINRYRPSTLDEVSGNKALVASLKSILERKRSKLPHSFMFAGPPGCGKTTLARIMALELGCEEQDIEEANAAQSTGIDFVREVSQWMKFHPSVGRGKAYILDECHRLSAAAQDALLKPLEEPPGHVFWFMCTTEPNSVKAALKRRCELYEVNALSFGDAEHWLKEIVRLEKAEVPEEIILDIIERAEAKPGLCLSMLDKVIGLKEAEMKEVIEQQSASQTQIIDLCRALMKKESWKEISRILSGIEDDPESVRRAVLGYCNAVALKNPGQIKQAWLVMDAFLDSFFNSGKAGLTCACYRALNA